jgi:hypothetical protein
VTIEDEHATWRSPRNTRISVLSKTGCYKRFMREIKQNILLTYISNFTGMI